MKEVSGPKRTFPLSVLGDALPPIAFPAAPSAFYRVGLAQTKLGLKSLSHRPKLLFKKALPVTWAGCSHDP